LRCPYFHALSYFWDALIFVCFVIYVCMLHLLTLTVSARVWVPIERKGQGGNFQCSCWLCWSILGWPVTPRRTRW
jgi:hypothetical protein